MINISEYGIKIKNMHAGMIYDVNLGVRDFFNYTDAMLNNSLFSDYLKTIGMKVKNETTRDLICMAFDYGSKDYNTEMKKFKKMLKDLEGKKDELSEDEYSEEVRKVNALIEKTEANKDKFNPKSRDEIRKEYYENGVDVTYYTYNKDMSVKKAETIHYKMLYRTSAKAKLGQVIFINKKLYRKAYDWLTMGLCRKMPKRDAKIVEMSAYAPLTTSTIVGKFHIPVEDVVILEDQDVFFKTMANVVRAVDDEDRKDDSGRCLKKCVVTQEEYEVKNTMWDGMGLIESELLPEWVNGMALLRNHMFKMCGVRTYIRKFFINWCFEHGEDYQTYQIEDMFGNKHYVKDIKMITTDNAIKFKKFKDLMGGDMKSAHEYWCERINADGSMWGIVKTDHPSKLGENQQMSYQMVNTLPCQKEEVRELADTSISYVELMKKDNDVFEKFLRKNANLVNHYNMMADLYAWNKGIANTDWFRNEKKRVINTYVTKLRNGKININADNLTVFGNPYALLLYAAGEDWMNDPCFENEDGCIQCYTSRFKDGEYLCGIRSPHNSPENIGYYHNVYSDEMFKYFVFSDNILAVNCIHTDIQARMNGMDFDSDFNFVTNNPVMVKNAKIAYNEYHTIVNALNESGITYKNDMASYAAMDSKLAKAQLGIGWSSNLAQLAMSYYWTELQSENPDRNLVKELHDNIIILATLAQLIIDGCKRSYEVDGMDEIKRIKDLPCMHRTKTDVIIDKNGNVKQKDVKYDFPAFMKYTRCVSTTRNGKPREWEDIKSDKDRIKSRIDPELICPMNWLEEYLDKIQNSSCSATESIYDYFIKDNNHGNTSRQSMSSIMKMINEYDSMCHHLKIVYVDDSEQKDKAIYNETEKFVARLQNARFRNYHTINRLIELALEIKPKKKIWRKSEKYDVSKYSRKILNFMYLMNKEKFLMNFVSESQKS